MAAEIDRCYSAYQIQKDDVDVASLIFRDFGKGRIKEGGISPDAFVQMAIQLANYKVSLFLQVQRKENTAFRACLYKPDYIL